MSVCPAIDILKEIIQRYRVVLVYLVACAKVVAELVITFPLVEAGIKFYRCKWIYLAVGDVVLYIHA